MEERTMNLRVVTACSKVQVPLASRRVQEEGTEAGWADVAGAPKGR